MNNLVTRVRQSPLRSSLIAGILFLLAALAFQPKPKVEPEPTFKERTVTEWFVELNRGATAAAGAAFRELGPEAIEVLIRKLRKNHLSAFDRKYAAAWVYFPRVITRYMPGPKRHEKQLSLSVAVALSHIGSKAVPTLILLSADPNPEVKAAATEALGMIDPEYRKFDGRKVGPE
jgi:HEAT repeat protein